MAHGDVATMLAAHGLPTGVPAAFADSLSGSVIERVGDAHVLKRMNPAHDWIMTALADPGWSVRVWASGLLDALPDSVETAYVDCAHDGDGWAVLLRDVGAALVPEGDAPISHEDNEAFLRTMRSTHRALDSWPGDGLLDLATRLREFDPAHLRGCGLLGRHPVPPLVVDGWARLADEALLPPDVRSVVADLVDDSRPLRDALARLPQTVVHGDWKLGNLGRTPDGRVVLLDWQVVGPAPGCIDLGWYLAVNSRRLPVSKEDCLELSSPWSGREMALGLLCGFLQLGWNKCDEPDELAWWGDWVREGARLL